MYDPLVVFEDCIFFVRVVVRLQRDRKSMSRIGWASHMLFLALVNSFYQIELYITLLGLLA